VTIATARLMKQSNFVASRDRIFLCAPGFAIQTAVAPLPYACLDQFLQYRMSAETHEYSKPPRFQLGRSFSVATGNKAK
jgi:hypothetical protein